MLLSLAALGAYALKRHYSTAGADDLDWVLDPATALVALLTGEPFVHEARVGFVAERLPLVVAPACAGVNFLVIAFLTLSFGFLPRLRAAHKALWLAACPFMAYGATLVANTTRISAAVWLHKIGLRVPHLSPAETHRTLGVVVYLGSLWVLYAVVERALGASAGVSRAPDGWREA